MTELCGDSRDGSRGAGASTTGAPFQSKEGTLIRRRVYLVPAAAAARAVAWLPASNIEAQGKGTIKLATPSPRSGGQAARGEGIKLGAQLAVEKFKGPLEKQGFKVELVPFDDQAKPDVGVANAKNIIADKDILAVIGHLNSGVRSEEQTSDL